VALALLSGWSGKIMNDLDRKTPGLDDPRSMSLEVRIARYEAYLTEWMDFKTVVHMAASISILMRDAEDGLQKAVEEYSYDAAQERAKLIKSYADQKEFVAIARTNTIALIRATKKLDQGREKLSLASAKSALSRAHKLSKSEIYENWLAWQQSSDRLSVNEWKEATSTAYGVKVDTLRRWHEGWKRDMKKA
jgi:hypothetical protein